MNNEINDNIPARTSPGLTRSSFATTRNRVANDICVPRKILRDTPEQVLFLSVFILQVVMHGEESKVPGDLRQSEILIEQHFKI
jgi:hypothetical protein